MAVIISHTELTALLFMYIFCMCFKEFVISFPPPAAILCSCCPPPILLCQTPPPSSQSRGVWVRQSEPCNVCLIKRQMQVRVDSMDMGSCCDYKLIMRLQYDLQTFKAITRLMPSIEKLLRFQARRWRAGLIYSVCGQFSTGGC